MLGSAAPGPHCILAPVSLDSPLCVCVSVLQAPCPELSSLLKPADPALLACVHWCMGVLECQRQDPDCLDGLDLAGTTSLWQLLAMVPSSSS